MSLFKSKNVAPTAPTMPGNNNYAPLAELTLNSITDGVLLTDEMGVIKFANPAAATMLGYDSPANVIGLGYQTVLRLETSEGAPVTLEDNLFERAFKANESFTTREFLLVSAQSERHAAISLTLTPTGNAHANRIITFRDITKELEDEHEQSEFISTASHEMRTPVASIEGYLGLALNPQTATIDERAKKYLEAAHASSQHLGRLFKDLLDVTKLDDGRLKVHEVPVDIVATVREMAASREKDMQAKHLKYSFGTSGPVTNDKQIEQLVYAAVDLDFLREVLDNLIDNAIKYTPEGGEIWINARGDGDKVLINVTDTGIGISPDDAAHIFQKFYRVDNSQTRQIGGTGLGLYLVKQRVEAMGGRVWVESAFGDGSTFFFSLPRLSDGEYRKRKLVYDNEQAVQAFSQGKGVVTANGVVANAPAGVPTNTPAGAATNGQPVNTPVAQPTVQPQAVQQPQPQPVPTTTNPAAAVAPAEHVAPEAVQPVLNTGAAPEQVPEQPPVVPQANPQPVAQMQPVAPAQQAVQAQPPTTQVIPPTTDSNLNQKENV